MNYIGMFECISESEVPENRVVNETVFNELNKGERVVVFAWDGGDEYVKAEFTVTSTQRDESESDDFVFGTINEESAKLRLPWKPAEPTVGITNPYPEPPIQLEYQDDSYDVVDITQ